MNKIVKINALVLLFVINLFAVDAQMEIVKKGISLPKISVNVASDSLDKQAVQRVEKIIEQDFRVSGHFEVAENKIQIPYLQEPNYAILRNQGIDLVLNITSIKDTDKGLLLYVKMYDINSGNLVLNQSFLSSNINRYPFLAHRIAISVNDHMKAPSIAWMDKFVIYSRYIAPKQSEIIIGDYTLAYKKVIVKGGLNVFPKWADEAQNSFYYTTYNRAIPTLVKVDLLTGKRKDIASSDGMIVVSDVSSDGEKLLLTMAPQDQPDVYLYNNISKTTTKITDYKGIDVGATFVENDTKIVFVSDRLSYPNIFAQKIGSRAVERLVFHGRNNSSVTTHENNIIYSSRDGNSEFSKNSFNLFLISTQSDLVKQLTANGRNQFPKFSKDGESVLFLKRYVDGRNAIGIIRLKHDKTFLFPFLDKNIQSIDW